MTLTTYLGFESLKTDDLDILDLKQELFKVLHHFQYGYFDKLQRVSERQDSDHNNVQIFETDYLTRGKDFTADKRPTAQGTVTPIFNPTIINLSGLTQ